MQESAANSKPHLLRVLGPLETITILVGSVIGSGIFLVPNTIAAQVGSFGLIIAVWLVSGLLTLFGALSYAELGGMIPHAGGQYAYLREAYGKLPAFLFGWTEFLVIKAGSIAAVAVAFALYFGYFIPESVQPLYHKTVYLLSFPIEDAGVKLVAIACILVLSIVNYLGVRFGGWVQNIFTFLKVGALAGLIGLVFILGRPAEHAFQPFLPEQGSAGLLSAFGVAMVAALWAYDGWNNATYVAAEVRQPQRNIPLALFVGTSLVVVIYLAANVAYAYVLPVAAVAQSQLVAADALRTFLGSTGGAVISGAVLISTFGTVNGMILSGARVTYAMANDRVFFSQMGDVHSRFRTPHVSIAVQGVWSALLTLSGRFDQLFTYVVFAAWMFYALTTGGVFVLRRKWPHVERPYRTWGYPFVPLLFIVISALFVVNTLITDPRDSLFGLVIVMLGVPAYFYWNVRAKRRRS
ncbi:MAG: amino acid permease [Chitinivibrionia bacterium]|nr:amino acid permease [Chitinivibrionia bacterium]